MVRRIRRERHAAEWPDADEGAVYGDVGFTRNCVCANDIGSSGSWRP
ncbi:MAG: hypothetical protein HOM25_17380 [Rhodospirillaceae bacterium]|nr:hypothetical protein [Rhodospirillaceae bacterium]MBT5666181.1 hypothetical protein [Rhodospirillaceae bacterium]MBT5810632.1 hypothetical protein [Rhodospirillaceae bacterium]